MQKRNKVVDILLILLLVALAAAFIFPIVIILINSFKIDTEISTNTVFKLPDKESFAGFCRS